MLLIFFIKCHPKYKIIKFIELIDKFYFIHFNFQTVCLLKLPRLSRIGEWNNLIPFPPSFIRCKLLLDLYGTLEFPLKSPGPPFTTSYSLFERGPHCNEILVNLGIIAETQHLMPKVPGNYSSCRSSSSENICSSSGGAHEKGTRVVKTGWNSVYYKKIKKLKKNGAFLSFTRPLMLMYFCAGFIWMSPGCGPN